MLEKTQAGKKPYPGGNKSGKNSGSTKGTGKPIRRPKKR